MEKQINFIAPNNTLGFGVVGLNILKSLVNQNCSVAYWPIGQIQAPVEDHTIIQKCLENSQFYRDDIPCIKLYHNNDFAMRVGRSKFIAYLCFELDTFTPIEKHHLARVDEIFVPSVWAKEIVYKNGLTQPCHVVPFGVDTKLFSPINNLNKSNVTTFLTCGKYEVRKGHYILGEAFSKAFTKHDNVQLIVNCQNPFYSAEQNLEWDNYFRNKLGNQVRIIDRRLASQSEVAQLMRSVDCGVFPSLGEGWGLETHEMLALGKRVIVTNYSGHTEYVNKENAYLIDINEVEPAFDGKWFFKQGNWAKFGESQMDQLVEHLQTVHKLKQSGKLSVNIAGIETANKFTWANTAKRILECL